MLKEKRQIFEFLYILCDLVTISVSWLLAYYLRFETNWIPVDKGTPNLDHYLLMLVFIGPIWVFIFRRMGLYKAMRGVRIIREIWLIFNANALCILIFIAFTYLFREKSVPFSRLVFLYFGCLTLFLTIFQRIAIRSLLKEVRRRGYNLRYVLLVGGGKLTEDIVGKVRLNRELGMQIVGCLTKDGLEKELSLPVMGKYLDIGKLLEEKSIDQVIIALPLEDGNFLPEIINLIGDSLVDVRIVPDIQQFVSLGSSFEEFEGVPVISVKDSPLSGLNLLFKRFFDFIFSLCLIVSFAPLMFLIAFIVRFSSRGPIFYKQERVSYDGSSFNILKFRTMKANSEQAGPGWTKPADARITPIGKFLRKMNLDELPQLFNVLFGQMSLVGPRPERPVYIKQFRQNIPNYMLRHKVPAGMTGWAQINGWRGDTSIDKRVEFDLYYIRNWSLFFDLKILILTVIKGFGKNAY